VTATGAVRPETTGTGGLWTAVDEALARAAASLVSPGSCVALNAGPVTHLLAGFLDDVDQLTVVTNSPRAAAVLQRSSAGDRTIILTGGMRTPADALVGSVAVAALQSLHVDMAFLDVHGVDRTAGVTARDILEAETNRAMIDSGGLLVVLADHSKWGTIGLSSFATLREVDLVITDEGMSERARGEIRSVTQLMTVGASHVGDR
jgi:DeoR/GlpR family transcriptional regulator of sugar metabolism